MDQRGYILKRKIKAFIESLAFYVCWIFPVKSNKVVFWTFEGNGGYGDSPKYIAEELAWKIGNGEGYELVWLVNSLKKEFPDYVKPVKNSLWNRAYHLSTARFWISNTRTFYGTKKRRGTTYIQTWHAIAGIKPIGKQRGDKLPEMARIVSEYDSSLIDYVLSGNEWSNRMWPDGLLYKGPTLKTGIPRCDILFHGREQMHKKYREKYGLPLLTNIMLYAPTFRGGSQNTTRSVETNDSSLDFKRLIQTLEAKFGGTWYIFLRLHPQVASQINAMPVKQWMDRLIDVSQCPDMNELIAACDMFVTDYSSSVFESAIMKQPSFLYVEDEEEYVRDRGNLLFDLEKLPFPLAYNMEELVARIERFDLQTYEDALAEFMDELGIFEDGNASKRVAELVEQTAPKGGKISHVNPVC